jgi:hypothetical protein
MKLTKQNFRTERISYLAAAALFLFFLIYSTPHQVHHAFDPNHSAPCLAFSVAKGCHLQLASTVELSIVQTAGEWVAPSLAFWVPYFTPSPFSQRAPPQA